MKKDERFIDKLKHPRGGFLVLIYLLTALLAAGSIASLFCEEKSTLIEVAFYVLYGFAGIFVAYTVYTVVIYAPGLKSRLIALMKKSKVLEKMLDNYGYRTVIVASVSMIINLLYVIFNGVLAILARSGWYASLTGYYALIFVLRAIIVFYHRKKSKGKFLFSNNVSDLGEEELYKLIELKKYRFSGVLLIILPLFLSFAILLMVAKNNAFIYGGWVIYAVAAHAFYKIIASIVNVVRASKNDDMTIKALRSVGFADALVSILALQTTLLYAFSDGTGSAFANAFSGAVVCGLTLALGIYMVINANKKIKELKKLRKTDYGREE